MRPWKREHCQRMNSQWGRILILLSMILVLAAGMCFTASAAGAKLTRKKLTLAQGETFRLRLKGASGEVEWDSTRPGVAEVNEKGLVQALMPGRCKIRASYGGKIYACKIVVQGVEFAQPVLTMVCGRRQILRFNNENVTGSEWTSSNPEVVSVKDGVATSWKTGTAVITAKCNETVVKCTIYVTEISPDHLSQAYPADKTNQGKILLAGSSSMDLWMDAPLAFAPYDVINTAIGGTTVTQWIGWSRKLITRYKPSVVVLYVGSNDLGNGELISGEQNAENMILLLKKISKKLKNTPIFYISINPCWSRKGAWKKIAVSNRIVRDFCERKKNLYYIDIVPAFSGHDGTPNPAYYLADKLHPSELGYDLWKQLVANQVKNTARKNLRKAQNDRKKSNQKA